MIRVSFQGERGAYSEGAAISFFHDKIQTISCQTFAKVLKNTEDGESDYSILPVENSLEGSVGESNDLLLSTNLNAIGEIYYQISHCLIGKGQIEDVDTVYSHPQALGQCRQFIQEHLLKAIPSYDTAGSVKIIKELNSKNSACIASKGAAKIYDVPVIQEGIADKTNNHTRFLIFSQKKIDKTKNGKTSIIFSVKHEAGALYQVIKQFHQCKVNLTKIESRPNKNTPWEYNFYVDFEGWQDDGEIKDMLSKIQENTSFLKILGSYPISKLD